LTKSAALEAWQAIKGIWTGITADSTLTWAGVRDGVRDAFIAGEFAVRNFRDSSEALWTWAKLQVVQFGATALHVLTDELPAAAAYVAEGIRNGFTEAFVAPTRQAGEMETRLQAQFDGMMGRLRPRYEEFKEARLAAFGTEGEKAPVFKPEMVRAAEQAAGAAGDRVGSAFAGKAAKEIHKFDAALVGSAESLARLAEYHDRLERTRQTHPAAPTVAPEDLCRPSARCGIRAGRIVPPPRRLAARTSSAPLARPTPTSTRAGTPAARRWPRCGPRTFCPAPRRASRGPSRASGNGSCRP
jgi:hypothetical protein